MGRNLLRKEVIQPQVPLRLPCYDFTPITGRTLGTCIRALNSTPILFKEGPIIISGFPLTIFADRRSVECLVSPVTSGTVNFRGVTGGVYKARERIHRGMLIHDY